MGAKATGLSALYLLIPIALLGLLVLLGVVSVKCGSGRNTDGHDFVNQLWMRVLWWRCWGRKSRESSDRSGSSSNSIVDNGRDIEMDGNRS